MSDVTKFYTTMEITEIARNLEKKYPEVFEVLEKCGVSPFSQTQPIFFNPYLNEYQSEDFSNIGRHCVLNGYVLEKITTFLVSKNVINAEFAQEIVIGGLLHDANKRFEIMRRKASQILKNFDAFDEDGYESGMNLIKNLNIDEKYLDIINFTGTFTSHKVVSLFLKYENNEIVFNDKYSLFEYLLFFADNISANYFENGIEFSCVTFYENRVSTEIFKSRYGFLRSEGVDFFENGYEYLTDINSKNIKGLSISYFKGQKIIMNSISSKILELSFVLDKNKTYEENMEYVLSIVNS